MRTIKKLLEIVLDEFEKERVTRDYKGICACVLYLEANSLITLEEKYFLLRFIWEKRPTTGGHFSKLYEWEAYFWEPWSKPPRVAWLKYLIEKESKK